MARLAQKKAAGAVTGQIKSLGGGAGPKDDFEATGVEKPESAKGMLKEGISDGFDSLVGREEKTEDAGGQDAGEEEEDGEEEAMSAEEAKEEMDDCVAQLKAFISFFQESVWWTLGPCLLSVVPLHFVRACIGVVPP